MKIAVVTGGLGFIGSNLINILSKKNWCMQKPPQESVQDA
jgi:nucleoside-diphosphate-sugar epimerase